MATTVKLYRMPEFPKQEERIDGALKLLNLEGMRAAFRRLAQKALDNNLTPYDFLHDLLETQMSWKDENRQEHWEKRSGSHPEMTLASFNFSFQPNLKKIELRVKDLASCRFIERSENVIFLGQKGVGKTHLSNSLLKEAIKNGYVSLFLTLQELIENVGKTVTDKEYHDLLDKYIKLDLLIIDELSFAQTTDQSADFLFKLIYGRHEKNRSTIFVSNEGFKFWDNLFKSKTKADAILDRIIERHHMFVIKGPSFRTGNNPQAGVLTTVSDIVSRKQNHQES